MKKVFLLLGILTFTSSGYAQLTGTKTIKISGGDYSSIATAISDLNSNGVGSGGVTFEIDANFTEVASNLTISTTSSTSSNPIIFKKVGSGANPLIYASAGSSTSVDGFIKISGTDYITFDGLDLKDTSTSTSTTTWMEWGYAIVKQSGTEGSQYVTIKNCNIILKSPNTNSVGILSANHTATSTTSLTVTASSGLNNNLKIFNNTISGAYISISVKGFAASSPYSLYDQNNEIGVDGGNKLSGYGGASVTAYGVYCIYQNNVKIANNLINNGTNHLATLYGIFVSTGVSSNTDIYKNTVYLLTSAVSSSTYGINNASGSTPAGNSIKIYDNIIRNFSNLSSSPGSFYGIYNSGAANKVFIEKNKIDSISIPGSSTSYCIYSSSACNFVYIDSNIINNISRTSTGTLYGIYQYNTATNGYEYIFDNTIFNLSSTSTGTVSGIYTNPASSTTKSIYRNKVYNLSSYGTTIYGIYSATGDTIEIFKNQINNLYSINGNASIHGIYISSGTNNWIYNNFISDIKAPPSSNANAANGVYIAGGTNCGLYFNTIYLDAIATYPGFSIHGVYASTSVNLEMKNNVIINNSTPGAGGVASAYKRSTTTTSSYNTNSNNNVFWCGTPSSSNVIFYDGTNKDSTLAQYKTRISPADGNSISELPPFVNITTTPYDLHLKTNVATQLESGGIVVSSPIAIADDIDGGTRNTSTPDMGADEGSFTGADLSGPSISYTPIANTSSTSARVLKAKIVDYSGVPTSGTGLPVLYYRKNSGSWNSVTATYSGNDTFSFSFNPTVIVGDSVKYYIVAQDLASTPNVSSKPAGASGFSINPPKASAVPANPDYYIILGTMSGVYYVGSGKDFNTITNAVNALQKNVVTGAITFVLTDNNYPNEIYPIILKEFSGASHSKKVTFKPNSNTNVVIETDTTTVFKFDAADFYTIEGSNNNSTSRNLTIRNNRASGTVATVWLTSNGNNGATNNTIKNCIVHNKFNTSGSYGIYFGGNIGSSGNAHHNLTLENNHVYNTYYPIDGFGTSSLPFDSLIIKNNVIGHDSLPISNIYKGIYISYCNAPIIYGNKIYNQYTASLSISLAGIDIGASCSNALIEKNRIYNLSSMSSGGWGAYGIVVSSSTSNTNILIKDNLIFGIKTYGYTTSTSFNPFGIRITGGTNFKIYHNTISLNDTFIATSAGLSAALIFTSSTATGNDIRNNIFTNSTVGGTGIKSYAAYLISTANYSTINYNSYYASGPNAVLGYIATDKTTFSDWKTTTNHDSNSYNTDPKFTSKSDFAPKQAAINNKAKAGLSSSDLFGNTRAATPDIGAIEFCLKPTVATLNTSNITSNSATVKAKVNANNEVTSIIFKYGKTTSFGNTIYANPDTLSIYYDSIVSGSLSNLNNYEKYYYTISATNACGTSEGADSNFITLPIDPEVITGTASLISVSGASVYGKVNPNKLSTTVEFEYGLTTTYGSKYGSNPGTANGDTFTNVSLAISNLIPNTTYHYRLSAKNSKGIFYGKDSMFTTLAKLADAVTKSATNISAFQASINGTVNANNSNTIVTFEWGTSTSYGKIDTAKQSPVNGTSVLNVSFDLSNLLPLTKYHYRVVAKNQAGTSYGTDTFFTTDGLFPSAHTEAASSISSNSAILNAKVNPNNSSTIVVFEWGKTTSYGNIDTASQSPVSGMSTINASKMISKLVPNTVYHYRVIAKNQSGTTVGDDTFFVTNPVLAIVLTEAASNLTSSSAEINAKVNPQNSSTIVYFEHGYTTSYGQIDTVAQSPVNGTSDINVSWAITGLKPLETYHYRIVGVNSAGTAFGKDTFFTTNSEFAVVKTNDAINIGTTTAKLKGNINPKNSSTIAYFQYGKTPAYGDSIFIIEGILNGMSPSPVTTNLSGLEMNTTYHFRLVAINSAGISYGENKFFKTDFKDKPTVTTLNANNITVTLAQINADVNPNNEKTGVHFEWGTSTTYGNTIAAVPDTLIGLNTIAVKAELSGLAANTTYHFRIVASNSLGTSYGNNITFTTDFNLPVLTTSAINSISDTTANSGGNITDDGGSTIIERGVVWSTSTNPDVSLSTKTIDGSGAGIFTSNIKGLTSKTTYYIRAYAKNAKGTAYGNELSFTTSSYSINNKSELGINLYLSNRILLLNYDKNEVVSLQIVDLIGKTIYNTDFISQTSFNFDNLSSGYYLIFCTSESGIFSKKIFIE